MSIKSKKILITGGAGFIGANFVYKFQELGCEVHVIDKREANFWRLDKIKSKININLVDLTKKDQVEKVINKIKPEIILHFATYGAYQAKQQDVDKTININLLGAINLIEACREVGFECFINTSSSSEYGIKDKPMKENDLLEPDNLYGVTKVATTLYCQNIAKKFNLPIITMRLFSVYGYFEEKERLIPTIINSFLQNKELELSSPNSVRDFIFIEDIMEAYLLAIENIESIKGEIFNLGAGKQSKISEVVEIVKKNINSYVKIKYGKVKISQTEPQLWVADNSKARKILKWQPRNDLDTGIKKNIKWFKDNLSLYK